MPFKIALRTTQSTSAFKRYLAQLIRLRAPVHLEHSVLITSGFFENEVQQELGANGPLIDLFKNQCATGKLVVISSGRGAATPRSRNVLRPRWPTITAYLAGNRSPRQWSLELDAFLGMIYAAVPAGKADPIERRAGGYWHAKVAMRIIDGRPIAALVGSSNLTRAAFSESYSYFNNECDVLIWLDDAAMNHHFFGPVIRQPDRGIDRDWDRDANDSGIDDGTNDDAVQGGSTDGFEFFGQSLSPGAALAGVNIANVSNMGLQLQDLYDQIIANTRKLP